MFYILFTFIPCKPCNLANSSAIHCKQRDTEEKGACKVFRRYFTTYDIYTVATKVTALY